MLSAEPAAPVLVACYRALLRFANVSRPKSASSCFLNPSGLVPAQPCCAIWRRVRCPMATTEHATTCCPQRCVLGRERLHRLTLRLFHQSCSIGCNGPNYVLIGASRICSGGVLSGAPQTCKRRQTHASLCCLTDHARLSQLFSAIWSPSPFSTATTAPATTLCLER